MKPVHRGAIVMVAHCLLVLTVAGKFAWDRDRLPRAWANATPVDPNLPIRGRYVSLQLRVDPADTGNGWALARLAAENGSLVAHPVAKGGLAVWRRNPATWVLAEPVAYFLPEHAPDPTRLAPGEELWVEVSVPPGGPPRPVRLGLKKDGVIRPL
ncbi:MAG TPA: hypothetical protein VMH28_06110 [Candidatus Acidoferrales bacterium]|nr:hypothetical protein [Candidatus Acidoferrales bacterium]